MSLVSNPNPTDRPRVITIPTSEREIRDESGELIFTASIYDLQLIIGSHLATFWKANPEGSRFDAFATLATSLNQAFGIQPPKLMTAGMAMKLTDIVEEDFQSLKKTESQPSKSTVGEVTGPPSST